MGKIDKRGLPANMIPARDSGIDRPQKRKRSGIYLESTEAEQLGVLPEECIRVKDAMSRSVYTITPSTEIEEAVRLMKSLGVGAVIVCHGSALVGTLSDRDIALANAHPAELVRKVMTPDPVYCHENDLVIDVYEMMRAHGLNALPVRDSNGTFSGILMRTE